MRYNASSATQNVDGKEEAKQTVQECLTTQWPNIWTNPSSRWKSPRIAATILQLCKSICRSCVTRPKDCFTRKRKVTRQNFHMPLLFKMSLLLRSTAYLTSEAYKSQKKTSQKVQDEQDSKAWCPTALPRRDSPVTTAPTCSLCLKGRINLCLSPLFSHPFPWHKGIYMPLKPLLLSTNSAETGQV